MRPLSIRSKLVRVFVSQAVFISVATFLGVLASAKVVENVLLKRALAEEADHFWGLYAQNPNVGLPNTRNLTGYLAARDSMQAVPEVLRGLKSDYVRITIDNTRPIVYRSDRDDLSLYLVFNGQQVSNLTFFFGVAPLSIVLITIYIGAWLAYRQSRLAISPVVQLAETVGRFDVGSDGLKKLDLDEIRAAADSEVLVLVDALQSFTGRLDAFVRREQNFTRDASHELRTPLAVIKGSLDVLENSAEARQPALQRIRRTVNDMEALLETLLLLARESELNLPAQSVILNDLVKQILETIADRDNANISIKLSEHDLLEIQAPEKVLSILFNNLLSNAVDYTERGEVLITLAGNTVTIEDNGPGMSADDLANIFEPFYRARATSDRRGHGLGLAIVKRLCDRFHWRIEMESELGKGTKVQVLFPKTGANAL